ncbi:odorant receptor 4-like [Prorops nasuta]|uniref:odorant receptor 4-like n=1 Tax=Prorops nasuta TaxID=863751 RepID=UPI0034CE036B
MVGGLEKLARPCAIWMIKNLEFLVFSEPRKTMDFEQKHFYSFNEFLLKIVGQWPYDSKYKNYTCRTVIIVLLGIAIFGQVSKIILIKGEDVTLTIDIIPTLTILSATLVCMISHYSHVSKFNRIFEELRNEWKDNFTPPELAVKEEYAKNGRALTVIFAVYVLGFYVPAETGVAIRSIFVIYNDTRKRHQPYASFVILANESMYAVYIYHICGMLDVVGYRLEQLGNMKFEVTPGVPSLDVLDYKKITQSVKTHQKAISIVGIMESYYGFSFLIESAAFVILAAFTLVQASDFQSLHIRPTAFAIAQILYLGVVNFTGQKLINSSTRIAEQAYSGRWYRCPVWMQKLMIPIIIRSQTPLVLTASKFFILSFENFRVILRAVISYEIELKRNKSGARVQHLQTTVHRASYGTTTSYHRSIYRCKPLLNRLTNLLQNFDHTHSFKTTSQLQVY